MKIAIIGTGYVGLVSGTCFAAWGNEVVCVDKDAKKIEALRRGAVPIYEPGLDELVERNSVAGRLSFTCNLAEALKGAAVVFIAVGTPSRRGDGYVDRARGDRRYCSQDRRIDAQGRDFFGCLQPRVSSRRCRHQGFPGT